MSRLKRMGLMLGLMAAATMSPNDKMDYNEMNKKAKTGGNKIRSRKANDRSCTMARLEINRKRKAQGLKPLMSPTRFGGYKID